MDDDDWAQKPNHLKKAKTYRYCSPQGNYGTKNRYTQ